MLFRNQSIQLVNHVLIQDIQMIFYAISLQRFVGECHTAERLAETDKNIKILHVSTYHHDVQSIMILDALFC